MAESKNKVTVRGRNRRSSGLDKMEQARSKVREQQEQQDNGNQESQQPWEPAINTGAKDCIRDDLAIASVSPDPQNARDFPVIRPTAEAMFLAQAENVGKPYVIIDKGTIVNKTPKNHPLYKHIQTQIDEIVLLAEQIREGGGIYQSIEVYRVGGTDYRIVFGHRRFYSVVYLTGWDGVWPFQVHRQKPKSPKLRQFAENNSRSDLALHEKIYAFKMAYDEIKEDESKDLTVVETMKLMGLKNASFYRYLMLNKFPFIYDAVRDGIDFMTIRELEEALKLSDGTEDEELAVKMNLAEMFLNNSMSVPEYLKVVNEDEEVESPNDSDLGLDDNDQSNENDDSPAGKEPQNEIRRGRKAKYYVPPRIKNTNVVKTLLTSDITKMEIEGINWEEVNWEDRAQVNQCLDATIKALEEMKQED